MSTEKQDWRKHPTAQMAEQIRAHKAPADKNFKSLEEVQEYAQKVLDCHPFAVNTVVGHVYNTTLEMIALGFEDAA
jgi:hypothetical protein